MKPKSIVMALWTSVFCAACGLTDVDRVRAAGAAAGEVLAERTLPLLPDDCRRLSRSGVREGDRLDVAVLKADAALNRPNARTARCSGWYDQLKSGWHRGDVQ
ncbi:hypothetical protein [Phaeobacter inhibens]|uniref:hypothetical protein n=1 Tax=Phaeobacter inhibens TaxID=221822 RepID=UPI000F4C8F54|nr:hypothetical protein [Phaeobacter inhibens]